mgnify:FL=1|jgi:hypothetical protein
MKITHITESTDLLGHKDEITLEQKVQQMRELVERAKHVRANSKKPKLVKPNTGHESPHPYDNAGFVGENTKDEQLPPCHLCKGKGCDDCDNTGEDDGHAYGTKGDTTKRTDEISMQDIKKGAQVAAVTGAIALGGAGIGKVSDYMDQGAFDYSIQLPQLEMYLDYAEAQKDQRMIKQLKTRIRNHEGRLSMGKGDVDGRDGTPLTFEVVYDKENPNFDPLGDPMQLNKKFKDARDNMPEGKSPHKKGTAKYKKHMAAMHAEGKKKPELPKQNNPVAKHSRNKSGAGAHVDKKKEAKKRGDFSPLDEAQYSADKAALLSAVLHELESEVLNADNTKMLRRLARLIGKKVFRRENGTLTLEDKE